jgi:hypothetical protein
MKTSELKKVKSKIVDLIKLRIAGKEALKAKIRLEDELLVSPENFQKYFYFAAQISELKELEKEIEKLKV